MAAVKCFGCFYEKIISRFVFETCFIFKFFHSRLTERRLFEEARVYYTVEINMFEDETSREMRTFGYK